MNQNQNNGIMNLITYEGFVGQYPQYLQTLTTLGGAQWYQTFISSCLSYAVFNNVPVSQLGTHLVRFFDQMIASSTNVRAAS